MGGKEEGGIEWAIIASACLIELPRELKVPPQAQERGGRWYIRLPRIEIPSSSYRMREKTEVNGDGKEREK